MSLDQLSDELILEVAKQLENIYGNRSLRPLVLCSHRLNNIVSPLLYRTFTQVWNKLAALPTLLLLVMEKPTVGAEIKTLVLSEIRDGHKESLDMSGYSPQDFEQCRTAMDSLADLPIDKCQWIAAVERGNWDAVVSLLLFFLPSLEEIDIESGGLSSWTYLDQVIKYMALNQRAGNLAHSLKHLKTFSTAYWDTEMGMGIHNILPFCALPSVTTVCANMLEQEDRPRQPSSERYQVQNLRMEQGCIGGNTIRNLLSCFTSLKHLYYDHGGATVGMADFLPQKIGEGIAHLHDCLEELTLLGTAFDEIYGDEPRRPLGSLAEFKKLRCIGMEAEVLLGSDSVEPQLVDILPASLETLVIRDCWDDIYPQLRALINGKREFPVLKTVAIDIPMARAGGLEGIGPDGKHGREEDVKRYIEIVKSHPENPDWEKNLDLFTRELAKIQSRKPTEEEWEEWRNRQRVEKELIAEYKEAGIELIFNLLPDDHEWTFMPPFMFYREYRCSDRRSF